MDTNKLMMATTVEHEFFDGSTVKCTLAMYRLKQLASKDKKLYDTTMKVLGKGTEDVFESIRVLYAAYICANMNNAVEPLLTEDEFVMMCGSDYAGINQTVSALINPKKRKVSDEPSN